MTAVKLKDAQAIQYPSRTVKRAERAMSCAPFQLQLFVSMLSNSVPLQAIAGVEGIHNQYTQQALGVLAVESALLWLIQVGILRREVDGQGITDSFRLTPLGRQLVEKYLNQSGGLPQPSFLARLYNFLNRWLPFL